jgi:hypothetical protein
MNKLLQTLTLASLMMVSGVSWANPNYYSPNHHHYGYYNPYGWVAPLVIGGAVGYAITRPQTVIIQQPPPNIYQPQAPYGYHYENILDANCNCYRLVLIQNQP